MLENVHRQSLARFYERFSASRFHAINFALARHGENPSALGAHWVQSSKTAERGRLLPMDMPCVDLASRFDSQLHEREFLWQGQTIRVLKPLRGRAGLFRAMHVLQDGRLALMHLDSVGVIPAWFWDGGHGVIPSGHNYCERFPPSWLSLATVSLNSVVFYNREHEWDKVAARTDSIQCPSTTQEYADALASAAGSKDRAIHLLFHLAAMGPKDSYTALIENHAQDLLSVIHASGLGREIILRG